MANGWKAGVAVVACVLVAAPALSWGNGSSSSTAYPGYGVHDAIAERAYFRLLETTPEAAAFLTAWYLDAPGDYTDGYSHLHLSPTDGDHLIAYTDDPDSVLQDWENHLYILHPRPGANEQGAPSRVAALYADVVGHLTDWIEAGRLPCDPAAHAAAYAAGLMAHYVGDVSQFGHTDDTRLDHSRPADDPAGRTYHGYYESVGWQTATMDALLAALHDAPYAFDRVADPEQAVIDLAARTGDLDPVSYADVDGTVVTVGARYAWMLDTFVGAYDAQHTMHGMRGMTPALWDATTVSVADAVDVLADLWGSAFLDAREAALVVPPAPLDPACPL